MYIHSSKPNTTLYTHPTASSTQKHCTIKIIYILQQVPHTTLYTHPTASSTHRHYTTYILQHIYIYISSSKPPTLHYICTHPTASSSGSACPRSPARSGPRAPIRTAGTRWDRPRSRAPPGWASGTVAPGTRSARTPCRWSGGTSRLKPYTGHSEDTAKTSHRPQ